MGSGLNYSLIHLFCEGVRLELLIYSALRGCLLATECIYELGLSMTKEYYVLS